MYVNVNCFTGIATARILKNIIHNINIVFLAAVTIFNLNKLLIIWIKNICQTGKSTTFISVKLFISTNLLW